MADWAVVYGLDDDGRPIRLDIAHHDDSMLALARELRDMPIVPDSAHPVLEVIRTRRSRIVADVSDATLAEMTGSERELEIMRALGVRAFMLVPMIGRGRVLGAIALVSSDPERRFDGSDLALAEDVAMRAALAVDNAALYSQAQRANQTKADFLAIVSHDLRTPLTAIMGYADLLEMGVPEPIPDASRERVQRIRTSARHLLYLLNELLAFARLDSKREQAESIALDVRDVVRDVAQVIDPLTQQRGLTFVVELPDTPVSLSSDPDKLRQILLNLAGNAVKFTERGEVRISLRVQTPRTVLLAVSDTGPGIADRHRELIFEPFWQLDATQPGRGGGTGLGLSVVKRLANLLGARVSVDSKPGAGSTFMVALRGD